MKKLLTVVLTLLMVFTLAGCNSKEQTPVVDEPQQEVVEPKDDEPVVGGYIDVEDGTLTDELKDIFNTALKGLMGATYEAQELVSTQVVAGTNYKFLANGTKTTNPITKGTYYITIYKDLQGNIELKDIEVIEEKQEEPKTNKQDITKMSFWIITYDQFGNEVSRTTAKYGATVYDPSTGKAVTVKGNTKFYVTKDYSSSNSKEVETSPPTHVADTTLHKGDVIKIMSEDSGYDLYLVLKINGNEATLVNISYQESSKFSTDDGEYENSVLDVACNTTFYGNLSSSLQDAIVEKTIELNQYTLDATYYDEDYHPLKTDISTKVTLGNINRKVYALDLEDIEEYLGSTYSIDEVDTITNGNCWFRSITSNASWCTDIGDGGIMTALRSNQLKIRPSFVIDLTKDVEYKKMIKVNLLLFNGNIFGTAYVNDKTEKLVDLDFFGYGSPTFGTEKTYGSNTLSLIDLGEGYYMTAFTVPFEQLTNVLSHDDLIAIEELLSDAMRGGDSKSPSVIDSGATQWSEVSSEYDFDMFIDVIYSFFYLDSNYDTNSSTYNLIINKFKPYLLSSNLTVADYDKIYSTAG